MQGEVWFPRVTAAACATQLLVLGRLDNNEGLRRICEIAAAAGYRVDHSSGDSLRISGTGEHLRTWHMGEELPQPDVVVHSNIKVSHPHFGLLEAWQRMGTLVLNPPAVGHATINKWAQQDGLAAAGIPGPHTELALFPEHIYQFAREFGYPFVVKPSDSSGAQGVVAVLDYRAVRERVEPFMDGKTGYVVQQLVPFRGANHRVRDRKAVVVGGHIITVMERTGAPGEVAASRNGDEAGIELDTLCAEERKYLPAAADAIGMVFCSVDYWLTDDHPEGIVVNEVNGFPCLPPREAVPFAHAVVKTINELLSVT